MDYENIIVYLSILKIWCNNDYRKIHHFKYKHKIFNKTLLLNVCHRFNDLNNDQ